MAEASWGPLAGVRVLDFSVLLPGPAATGMLADLGADVVKVEPLAGDPFRTMTRPDTMFRNANRNKRSIALNLKHPASRQVVERLAERSDVALEAFRPGVAARLGIDSEHLRKINPGLVYCSLSGYGQDGPWRDLPGHDGNYLAAAGALAFSGHWLEKPMRSGLPVADLAGGSLAVIAILAALREREGTGKGAYLDMSLFESALFYTSLRHGMAADQPNRDHLFPLNDLFETADGQRIAFAPVEEHFWQGFQRAIGDSAPALLHPDYATPEGRRRRGDELAQTLHALFRTRTAAEWMALFERHDLPAQLCLTPAQAAAGSQATAREMVLRMDGEPLVPFPVRADGRRGGVLKRGAPSVGQDTLAILEELGFEKQQRTALVERAVVGVPADAG